MRWAMWTLLYWVVSVLVAFMTPVVGVGVWLSLRDPAGADQILGGLALWSLIFAPIAVAGALVAGGLTIALVRALQLGEPESRRVLVYVGCMAVVLAAVVLGTAVLASVPTYAWFVAGVGGVPLIGSIPVLAALRRRGLLPGSDRRQTVA